MMKAVDLFAGAGGSTTGALAAGVEVLFAANHWQIAVDTHAMNHTSTSHVCQDLTLFPSCQIPDHDILLASPSCKGFSPARGKDQAHHDKHRATAWCVIDAIDAKQPKFAVIENVPDMRKWRLYPMWLDCLHAMGYSTQELILDSADFGVPQERKRLFVVANRGKHCIDLEFPEIERVPVSTVLDWSAGRWSKIAGTAKKPRAQATLNRIAQAERDGFGDRFIMPYYGSGSGKTGRSLDRPIGTITTVSGWALVDRNRDCMRMLSVDEAKQCMGFPSDYLLPNHVKNSNMLLGNAVCPPVMTGILNAIQESA